MSKFVILGLLTTIFILSEIYHWLPVTTSERLANQARFGDYILINGTNITQYTGTGGDAQKLFSVYYVVPISFATIIFGTLADNFNKRLIISCAFIVMSASQIANAFATSYISLSIFRVIIGFFSGSVQPVAGAIITNSFNTFQSKAMSIFNWGIYLGYAASMLVARITDDNTWRYAYMGTGAAGLFLALCVLATSIENCGNQQKLSNHDGPTANCLVLNTGVEPGEEAEEKTDANAKKQNRFTKFFTDIPLVVTEGPNPGTKFLDLMILLFAGVLRHTAGFSWGYNQKLYFEDKFGGDADFLIYLMLNPVISGVIGTTFGGAITDYLKNSERFSGIRAALLVLTISHVLAAALMMLVLTLDSPYCFICLFLSTIFAETWYGIYLVAMCGMFRADYRGQVIGYTIFILRLVAGNLPGLIVSPLRSSLGYYWALAILIPLLYFSSAIVWAILFIKLKPLEQHL